jgi:hypothetical protein
VRQVRNIFILLVLVYCSCSKAGNNGTAPVHENFICSSVKLDGVSSSSNNFTNTNLQPGIRLAFSTRISRSSATAVISFTSAAGAGVPVGFSFQNNDSVLALQPTQVLNGISAYTISIPTSLVSQSGGNLTNAITINLTTTIDSSSKFPQISDSALLTLVQQQTFKYFWDFGHPVSGMARERNTSGDVVTTGGTGFGIMAMLAAINRGFISRADGLSRITTIVNFLATNCTRYHGAFAHWINGATGATVPFSTQDNGADLVETSYLVQGLLCARQYFNTADAAEKILRDSINAVWNGVEWNWFRQGGQNKLYWHWSPTLGFAINMPITGWNEAMIVYVLGASSNTDPVPSVVYNNGWAGNGGMKNGNTYFNTQLPLGPAQGGPLFFAHYSFLGINPNGLADAYANYATQNIAHSLINYSYCVSNPSHYFGYSSLCWGLTASDEQNGYSAHSPANDNGTISPTAAISSLPYIPAQSMNAMRFFYYTLGDKIWGQYGFTDAFNLNNAWFAGSYLAIDQGPQIVMIENYRSGLLWNLFTGCPEVKLGMKNLGFSAPYL